MYARLDPEEDLAVRKSSEGKMNDLGALGSHKRHRNLVDNKCLCLP